MKSEKKLYIYILNIISCLAVIFLHCNGIVHGFSNTRAWKTSLIFEVVFYFAVPVFFMISGANLLTYRKKYDTKTFFKKRIFKVLVPYFVWSLIYYIIYFKRLDCLDFFTKFLNCSIENVFWFFPAIISVYLFIPVLAELVDCGKEYILKYLGILMFTIISVLQYGYSIFNKSVPSLFTFINGNLRYLIYIILGYFLSKCDVAKKNRILIYISAVLCLMFRYFYTYHFSIEEGLLNKNSWGYTSIIAVIPAMAVFLFVKNINWKKYFNNAKTINILATISGCSFGIYLIHILVKSRITKFLGLNAVSIYYRAFFPFLVYFLCLFIVYILKKIPIIKKILP